MLLMMEDTLVVMEEYQIQHKHIVLHFIETGTFGKTLPNQIAVLQTLIGSTFQFQIESLPAVPRANFEKKISSFVYKFQKRYSKKHSYHPEQILALPWSLLYFQLPLEVVHFIKNGRIYDLEAQESVSQTQNQDDQDSVRQPISDSEDQILQTNTEAQDSQWSLEVDNWNQDFSQQMTNEKPKQRRVGRTPKAFELKQKRAQLAVAEEIRKKYPSGAIKLAFEQSLKSEARTSEQKKDLAFVIKKCSSATGLTAKIARDSISKPKKITKKNPEEALYFILTNGLSKLQYKNLKKTSKESGFDIWPNYDYVREAK
jgi:hypothetical protein